MAGCAQGLRILDPACGSGAFLIEAFDQLHALTKSPTPGSRSCAATAPFRSGPPDLQNNLYGVISTRSHPDMPTQLVDQNRSTWQGVDQSRYTIREGNSVVAIRRHPALDWVRVSRSIRRGRLRRGGRHPPYIRQEWLALSSLIGKRATAAITALRTSLCTSLSKASNSSALEGNWPSSRPGVGCGETSVHPAKVPCYERAHGFDGGLRRVPTLSGCGDDQAIDHDCG